ncbi:MAG TPA: hypothetical protein VFK94_06020 [Patescibacteria group bacterium]|nr:hypothetical protein [Patescibacteria group bacterium]
MDEWWGPQWHAEHENKIRVQLHRLYGTRFACSNQNLIWLLRRDPKLDPCQAHFSFDWLSKWGERPEINVRVSCTCGEVFQRFYAILDNHGQIISDTLAPWLLPIAA